MRKADDQQRQQQTNADRRAEDTRESAGCRKIEPSTSSNQAAERVSEGDTVEEKQTETDSSAGMPSAGQRDNCEAESAIAAPANALAGPVGKVDFGHRSLVAAEDNLTIQHSPDRMAKSFQFLQRIAVGQDEVRAIAGRDAAEFRRLAEVFRVVDCGESQDFRRRETCAGEVRELVVEAGAVANHRGVGSDRETRARVVQFAHGSIAELHPAVSFGGGKTLHGVVGFYFTECGIDEWMALGDQHGE